MCDQCDNTYFSNDHLREHRDAADSTQILFSEFCTFTTNRDKHLRNHIAGNHEQKKVLSTSCSFQTSSKFRLTLHNRRKHTSEEDYPKCPWPDCTFSKWNKKQVNLHYVKVHTGNRFQCKICPNTFSEKHNMQAHIVKVHNDLVVKTDQYSCRSFDEKYTFLNS